MKKEPSTYTNIFSNRVEYRFENFSLIERLQIMLGVLTGRKIVVYGKLNAPQITKTKTNEQTKPGKGKPTQ